MTNTSQSELKIMKALTKKRAERFCWTLLKVGAVVGGLLLIVAFLRYLDSVAFNGISHLLLVSGVVYYAYFDAFLD